MKNAFWELLRSSLWNAIPNPNVFQGITPAQWEQLFGLIREQAVVGICFPAMEKLPKELRPPRILYLSWFGYTQAIAKHNQQIHTVWVELNERLEEQGIHPILLKGLGVASCYPEPSLRMTGDLDICIPENYDEAVALIAALDIPIKYMPQHDTFEYKGVHVELHKYVIDSVFDANYKVAEKAIVQKNKDGSSYRILDEYTYFMLLLTHPAKHLIYLGVGFRHLCDCCVFLEKNREKLEKEQVKQRIRDLEIARFASVFLALGIRYAGLDQAIIAGWLPESRPVDENKLLKDMLTQGDCGGMGMAKRNKGTNASSPLVSLWYWCVHYGGLVVRQMKYYRFWPYFVKHNLYKKIVYRLKQVLKGKPYYS